MVHLTQTDASAKNKYGRNDGRRPATHSRAKMDMHNSPNEIEK